jgi:hypothetical protein
MPTPSDTSDMPYPQSNSTLTDMPAVPTGTGTPDMPGYSGTPDMPPKESGVPDTPPKSTRTLDTPATPSETGSTYPITGSGQNKTMTLDVIYDFANETTNWLFFTSSPAKPTTKDTCRTSSPVAIIKGSVQVGKFPAKHDGVLNSFDGVWPGGEFKVTPYGKTCNYMNNGTNPGGLWCDGHKLDCLRYPGSEMMNRQPVTCANGHNQVGIITCQWHEEMKIPGNKTTAHWMSNKHNGTHFKLE